jgi:spore coat protein CotH
MLLLNLRPFKIFCFIIFALSFSVGCSKDVEEMEIEIEAGNSTEETDGEVEGESDAGFIPTDWTDLTHSKDAVPNFEEVFPDDEVKRLDIVITSERWQSMLDDMTASYGTFGSGGRGGGLQTSDENPIFVPAEVFYKGKEWYRVGVRFKGNSSLQSTWRNGNLKLSFKLDFDEFEDEYPQIKNQRFYGFKKLSLKNNFDDSSFIREKVAADVFADAGLAMSHTAFYTVYVDNGNGPVYFGLYTLVEEVDDTVIETQFSDDSGNLYKPDGDAATFASGSYNASEYEKKTNEDEADFSDVQSLLNIINDNTRTTNTEAWRTNLETVFNTDVFLKYLAVNTVIQNWDTYGRMTHNYLLYNNPATKKLVWIPWDNNEALQEGKRGGSYALNFSGLNASEWPIIGNMYQDEVYKAKYNQYVQETVNEYFNSTKMDALYTKYQTLIEEYATSEISGYTFLNSSADFYSAINQLKSHASSRAATANSYLQ